MTTTLTPPPTKDEADLRTLISKWSRALESKNVAAMMANYLEDAHLFDIKPPYRIQGAANIRAMWEQCLPYFPAAFKSGYRDLEITVSGDLAYCHGLHHIEPLDTSHPAGITWIRVTACYKKVNGRWMVAHEHVSIPFNPMDGKVAYITDPDAPGTLGSEGCSGKNG